MTKQTKEKPLPSEWSYLFDASDLENGPVHLSIKPDESEHKDLARRLNIIALDDLQAELDLYQQPATMVVQINGWFKATLTQRCVVTLEPLKEEVEENFEAWYADSERAVSFVKERRERQLKKGGVEIPVLDESEDPEPIIDGKIDVGELVTQYLSLAINPYPHSEGIKFEHGDDQKLDTKSDLMRNPFAKLKEWKERNKG